MKFTDYFPEGCRILFFDPQKKSRHSISTLLTSCSNKVRTFVDVRTIHRVLGEYGSHFDLILCNAGTAHGDSMELLRIYGGTVPVVLLSENPNKNAMIRAAKMGACDFLLAPFTPQAFSTLWQHPVRKMVEQQAGELRLRIPDAKPTKKRSCTQKGTEAADKKVGRHDWTKQEKQAFNNLDEQIGVKEATPKVIHELMNNPSLTRDHVKRQLEKYRQKLEVGGEQQYLEGESSIPVPFLQGAAKQQVDNEKNQNNRKKPFLEKLAVQKQSSVEKKKITPKQKFKGKPLPADIEQKIVQAAEIVGIEYAMPEDIYKMINTPTITVHKVAARLRELKRKAVEDRLSRESYQQDQQIGPSYHGFLQQPADLSVFNKDFWDDTNVAQEQDQPQLQMAGPLFVDSDVTNLKTGMGSEDEEAPPLTVDEFLEETEMGYTSTTTTIDMFSNDINVEGQGQRVFSWTSFLMSSSLCKPPLSSAN